MDLLDRIAAVLRALFADAPSPGRSADPDLSSAWDELDGFLDEERATSESGRSQDGAGTRGRGAHAPRMPYESLRSDYANLEVPFGADIETVRRSYKRLMLRYHPDRHAGDPEKLRVATEITKKLNESFERIRGFQERTGGGSR
jgi:DnaJ-domain-containing protein 1